VDDFLHAAFIAIDRARPVNTISARLIDQARRETQLQPALVADGAVQRMGEPLPATRARRLK
jgi:hypothetical protein